MILASHSADIIDRLCNKVLWLSHGSVVEFGPTQEVLQKYVETTGNARF